MGRHAHDKLNHTLSKIIHWFRKEFPDAMQYIEKISCAQSHSSCPPFSDGKEKRASFKQNEQNRYALPEAFSPDSTGPITPADTDGNKYIQILVDAFSGRTDVQIMQKKSGTGNSIIRSPAKIQRLCEMK